MSMSAGSVVYSKSIRCPSCGLLASGYLQVRGDGTLESSCSRCGATILQPASADLVAQMPPQPYHVHTRHDHRQSRYPGLYSQPKEQPRLDLGNLARLAYAPTRALTSIYRSSDLRWAMVLVLVFAVVYSAASAIVTAETYDVVGMDHVGWPEAIALGALELLVAVASFLIFALVSSIVASEMFGGRGARGPTVTLTGYCFPWFVIVSIVLMAIFTAGFSGLELNQAEHWSSDEIERAFVWGAMLVAGAILGLLWLLVLVAKAIGVANDVSTGEAALSAVVGAIVAGLVSFAMGAVVRLPIGLSF